MTLTDIKKNAAEQLKEALVLQGMQPPDKPLGPNIAALLNVIIDAQVNVYRALIDSEAEVQLCVECLHVLPMDVTGCPRCGAKLNGL